MGGICVFVLANTDSDSPGLRLGAGMGEPVHGTRLVARNFPGAMAVVPPGLKSPNTTPPVDHPCRLYETDSLR